MKDMKVGEIREYNGIQYRCVRNNCSTCFMCSFAYENCITAVDEVLGTCVGKRRSDKLEVVFVEV